MVEIDIGPEALGIAADDGERQRQIVARCADDGFGAAADADPSLERPALDRGKDALLRQRRPRAALPGHRLAPERFDLVLEQRLVLRKVVAEQRKRLDERAAPQRHLGAPVRGGVERRETLEHADRIVRGEHGDGGAEADAVAAPGDRREHDLRRRDGEIGPMVLADAKASMPSAWTPASITLRMTSACVSGLPSGLSVMSPNVSRPN
jgi:hypothetical protein